MKHFAITITRTCGSGGTSIAKILSAYYGIEYYDRMLSRLAADDSGINETVFAAADEDTKKGFLFSALQKVYKSDSVPTEKGDYASSDELFAYQARVMRDLLKDNSFILIGRAGDYVLKDYPYLLRVFVHANYEDCLRHEMDIRQCSEKDAATYIAHTNKYRSEYYKHFTGREWTDVRNYDLVLDTSRFTYAQCADMIKVMVAERFKD